MIRALVIFVLACGGAKPAASPPPPAGSGSPGCDDPGRCLEDISNAIGPYHADARACFDKEHVKNPKLAGGRLKIQFTIDPAGKVTDISESTQNDVTDPDVVQCVEGVVQKVQFAPSPHKKTTHAYHKFEFGT